MCRRCGERDRRGGARDRRARKRWLLTEFGDGTSIECFWGCGTKLTFATVQQDRIVPGGPYRRDNLVPSCADCNIRRGAESIPEGCHYGLVGDLVTDRHGCYLDEPELAAPDRDLSTRAEPTTATAAITIPQPRSGSAALSGAGDRPGSTASHEGLTAMHSPRPHRSIHRTTPPPEHQRQPAAVSALALAEHAHDDRPVVIAPDEAASIEPDLVVIDTTNLDELRGRHPWMFTAESRTDDPALHVHNVFGNRQHRDAGAPPDRLDASGNTERPPWLDTANTNRTAIERMDTDLTAIEQALDDNDEDDRTAAHAHHVVDDTDGYDAGWGR